MKNVFILLNSLTLSKFLKLTNYNPLASLVFVQTYAAFLQRFESSGNLKKDLVSIASFDFQETVYYCEVLVTEETLVVSDCHNSIKDLQKSVTKHGLELSEEMMLDMKLKNSEEEPEVVPSWNKTRFDLMGYIKDKSNNFANLYN